MILYLFLFFVSFSPTFCLKGRMLESISWGYDFPIKEFVILRLPDVPEDPWEGVELWSQWSHLFSLPKQKVHVLLYRCTRKVTRRGHIVR